MRPRSEHPKTSVSFNAMLGGWPRFGTTVLELVMAEYFETSPRIDFASGGVCYEVIGSLEAITGQH